MSSTSKNKGKTIKYVSNTPSSPFAPESESPFLFRDEASAPFWLAGLGEPSPTFCKEKQDTIDFEN